MNPALLIDGADASATYGFKLATPQGWRDMPAIQRQMQNVPGRAGALRVGLLQEQPRTLKLSGTVRGSSADDARAKLDALAAALAYDGGVGLSFGDNPTRELVATLDGLSVTPGAASMLAMDLVVDLSLTCLRPYAEDLSATNVDITGTDAALVLGTAPVLPVLTIVAGAALTNPTLTLSDSSGKVVTSLALTIALVAGDVLVIDCDAATITLNGASRMDALTSGDFLVLDVVAQGNYSTNAWPKLHVSFGSGATYTCTATYKRAWLA